MLTTIVFCVVGALLAALVGYKISASFWGTGDDAYDISTYGMPSGGILFSSAGMLLSMVIVMLSSKTILPMTVALPLFITVMVAGLIGGLVPPAVPLFRKKK
jgi:hypothetical protein